MALKIFLSSVDEEFRAERNAIREQIERLGEHCVCMERYGAVPQAAAEYDAVLVATCDLYVCLAGQGYGSIEPHSGKSYTEAEFDAAVMRHLPCLLYFKDSAANDDPRQAAFKSRLRGPERIVYSFRTVEELKTQFLLDFIRELRTTLLDKFAIEPLGPLSWQTIHSLTAGILKEQIRIVAGDR